jgi:hypothetical protein
MRGTDHYKIFMSYFFNPLFKGLLVRSVFLSHEI